MIAPKCRRSFVVLAFFAAACSDEGSATSELTADVVMPDADTSTTVDVAVPPECATAEDCAGKVAPGPCEEATCTGGTCGLGPLPAGSTGCDDGDPCTADDTCDAGQCLGTLFECDDQNPCTTDSCDPGGTCNHDATAGAACDDLDACTAGETCSASGACEGGASTCECQSDADCAPFDDGDLCNGTLSCLANECVIEPATLVACDPGLSTACLQNACVAATGACELVPVASGKPCDDGSLCTTGDACDAGACGGDAVTCDDGSPCTQDACAPLTGCTTAPGFDGAPCTDGDACTLADACAGGACQGAGATCDDGNPCTTDGCDGATGCTFVAAPGTPCEDGNACTTADTCVSDVCFPGGALACDDENPCTTDGCDPSAGCTAAQSKKPCDDGDPCSLYDTCAGGECAGAGVLGCDDANPCTDDSCTPGDGCAHAANTAPCSDGNSCTLNDACQDNACASGAGTCGCEVDADCAAFEDGDLCNGTLRCDKNAFPFACKVDPATVVVCDASADTACAKAACTPETGACAPAAQPDGSACSDGDACTTADACQDAVCAGGAAVDCEDNDPCTLDGCAADSGCTTAAVEDGLACNDGNACTDGDGCLSGACAGGPATPCGDQTPCTVDTCDALTGCVHTPVGLPCDDGDPCTASDVCVGGQCFGKGLPSCDDGSGCTADACDSAQGGCVHTDLAIACEDGNACTANDACAAGACTPGAAVVCDDANPCTTDVCDKALGCDFKNNQAGCDDGNACSSGDACKGGSCVASALVACDDANECTNDACDPASGCTAEANQKPCNDGVLCTVGDTCAGGECVPGPVLGCDDGNPCTTDACDAAGACGHAAADGPCDDGNPCTPNDACAAKACKGTGVIACDDQNACTDDTCVPPGGCVHKDNVAACDDGDVCTAGETCAAGACGNGAAVAFCCNADADCNDGSACTADTCKDHACTNTPSGTEFYTESFDSGVAAGFTFTTTNPSVNWQVDATNAVSPQYSLYWGNADTHTYDYGDATSQAVLAKLKVPYSVAILSFNLFKDTQDDDCDFDVLSVYVNGEFVHDECDAQAGWKVVHVDLSAYAGQEVELTLEMATNDDEANDGTGVFIDNLQLSGGVCQGSPCTSHAQCQSGALCSGGACVDGKCDFKPSPPNLFFGEDFDDMPVAAGGAVPQGWALSTTAPAIVWTTSEARAASGKQSLYAGKVSGGGYVAGKVTAKLPSIRIPNGFESMLAFRVYMDVADASCTTDVLKVIINNKTMATLCESTGGQFVDVAFSVKEFFSKDVQPIFEVTYGAGGASEGVYIDDVALIADIPSCGAPKENFDDAIPFDFEVESTNAQVYWHISTKQKSSGTRSFHAANPATHKYDNGAADAAAHTAVAVCPTGKLSFFLNMVVGDQGCDKDTLSVAVGPDVLFTQCKNTTGWQQFKLDLANYQGMTVPVTFRFVSDAAANAAEGAYIDDVVLNCQ